MTTCKRLFALSGCLLLGAASVVQADTTKGSDVQAELSAMRSRIAQLEGQQNQSWLNERRAEEVKSLVREVLTDADTRSSFADGGLTAHYGPNGATIASEDGRSSLTVRGQLQLRYTYNIREGKQDGAGASTNDNDKNDGYFSTPRARLIFEGNIADPRLKFYLAIATKETLVQDTFYTNVSATTGTNLRESAFFLEEYSISYDLADGLTVWGGRVTAPLVRGSMIDSSHTLAADRSLFAKFYNIGRFDGIGATYFVKDSVRLMGQLYDNESTEFGLVGRVDFKAMGEWSQIEDFSSWSGEGQSLVFGVSGAYEEANHGQENGYNNSIAGVADVSFESNGLGLYLAGAATNVAFGGRHTETYGVLIQGNYMFVPDKFEAFARYEYIKLKDSGSRDPNLFTIGANYYMARHNAKFTADVQYAPRGIGASGAEDNGGSAGLRDDVSGNRNQVALRLQFQLLF